MGAFDSVTKKISSLVGITAKGQAAKANSLPIALASDQVGPAGTPAADVQTVQGISGGTPVAVGNLLLAVSATLTRPSDSTPYATGDAVTDSTTAPTVLTFTNCVRAVGGSGTILFARLVDSANQATKGLFELWLFTAPPTPDNDNAVFTPTDAELLTLVSILPFSTAYVGDATAGAGGNCTYPGDVVNRPFVCGGATRNLYGLVVVRNAFTPVSGEVFTPTLFIGQDK